MGNSKRLQHKLKKYTLIIICLTLIGLTLGCTDISDANDANTTNAQNGQALIWHTDTNQWKPTDLNTGNGDIDGGFANSVYLTTQNVDGGNAYS